MKDLGGAWRVMSWLVYAAAFALLAAALWLVRGPGPRAPLLLLIPAGIVSALYLANALAGEQAGGRALDLFLTGPGGTALFAVRAVCILLALAFGRGARLFVIAAALALLALDETLVVGVMSMFGCGASACV